MKLSLLDHAKIILAFALAFAATLSFHRTARIPHADWCSALFADGVISSILLTAFAYVSVRPGPRRVALMEALVLSSALCFLMFMIWRDSKIIPQHFRGGGVLSLDGNDWGAIMMDLGVTVCAGFLIGRLGRRTLIGLARRRSPLG